MASKQLQKLRDKLAALDQRKAQLDAQIKDRETQERAQAREQARREDTHIKVTAGALSLTHMEKNPDSVFARTLYRLLDEYVTAQKSRDLFNARFEDSSIRPLPPLTALHENDQTHEPRLKESFKG